MPAMADGYGRVYKELAVGIEAEDLADNMVDRSRGCCCTSLEVSFGGMKQDGNCRRYDWLVLFVNFAAKRTSNWRLCPGPTRPSPILNGLVRAVRCRTRWATVPRKWPSPRTPHRMHQSLPSPPRNFLRSRNRRTKHKPRNAPPRPWTRRWRTQLGRRSGQD